jgi:hypothetical protein
MSFSIDAWAKLDYGDDKMMTMNTKQLHNNNVMAKI